jgi:type IV pilus assembly protein PilA
MSLRKKNQAFTLLEILLVVGIIAILAGIVIVALNPTKQFASVRNTQRKANLSELNKALYQYYIDNSRYPTSVSTTLTEICATGATSTGHSLNCTNRTDLSYLVPTYLVAIPTDPQASGTSTGYLVAKNTANKIHLKADNVELSQTTTIGDTSGVLPDHLVSYWSFDDAGSGTALDTMGINNGTVNGATATTGVRGVANTAYSFDGVNDYIDAGASLLSPTDISQPYTLSVWIKTLSSANPGGDMISQYDGGGNRFAFMFRSGYVNYWHAWNGGATITANVNDNNWHHIVAVKINNLSEGLKIYVDGLQNVSGNDVLAFGNTNTKIGGGSSFFNGSIDSTRIYNKALSADEVLNIYNAEKP